MKRKSMLPTPENLTLDQILSHFATDEKARAYLEEIRWPDGVVCPHCKIDDQKRIWKIEENTKKKIRAGLYQCAECKAQFTVTVGTIFEDSHIPLRKWLIAWYLLCSSKKGISALQIQRMLWGERNGKPLGSYRTALFMMHRIRYALAQPEFTTYLKGVVEVDETYVGGKATGSGKTGRSPDSNKTCVVSLVQRGGQARSFVMDRVTAENLHKKIDEHGSCIQPAHSHRLNCYFRNRGAMKLAIPTAIANAATPPVTPAKAAPRAAAPIDIAKIEVMRRKTKSTYACEDFVGR